VREQVFRADARDHRRRPATGGDEVGPVAVERFDPRRQAEGFRVRRRRRQGAGDVVEVVGGGRLAGPLPIPP